MTGASNMYWQLHIQWFACLEAYSLETRLMHCPWRCCRCCWWQFWLALQNRSLSIMTSLSLLQSNGLSSSGCVTTQLRTWKWTMIGACAPSGCNPHYVTVDSVAWLLLVPRTHFLLETCHPAWNTSSFDVKLSYISSGTKYYLAGITKGWTRQSGRQVSSQQLYWSQLHISEFLRFLPKDWYYDPRAVLGELWMATLTGGGARSIQSPR